MTIVRTNMTHGDLIHAVDGTSTWAFTDSSATAITIMETGSDTTTCSGVSPYQADNGACGYVQWSAHKCNDKSPIWNEAWDKHKAKYTKKTFRWDEAAAIAEEAWYDGVGVGAAGQPELSRNRQYKLPDGAFIDIDSDGNYQIRDKDAKVTYKANRIRDFSPHLNASDMLADFVRYVGSMGLRQSEVMGLPLELFIRWLVIQAAERDGDPIEVQAVEGAPEIQQIKSPKCLKCGRFIPRRHFENRFPFCNPQHGAAYLELVA